MIIGLIIGAIIGKYVAPAFIRDMELVKMDKAIMKYIGLHLENRGGWTQKGSFFTRRWISPTGKCMSYRYLNKRIMNLNHSVSFFDLNEVIEEFEK